MPPKISYVSCTARPDYPYIGRPDLHLFYPTLDSLRRQSFKDFEWIIVDRYYHLRKDYYKKLELPYTVKHIPAQPNFWLERGLPGVAHQYNKGLIYADGEIVFFGADGMIFPPRIMEHVWKWHLKGYTAMPWYIVDWTYGAPEQKQNMKELLKHRPAVEYDCYGYNGSSIAVDHRYDYAFGDNTTPAYLHTLWSWFFSGCSTANMDHVLEVNGFDTNFDGDKMLMDVDLASRLEMNGHANYVMPRSMFLIRPALKSISLSSKPQSTSIKCNYGLIGLNRHHKRTVANRDKVTDEDIQWIKTVHCSTDCKLSESCRKDHPFQYPFEHKSGYMNHTCNHETFSLWKNNQQTIDLEEERELRYTGNQKYIEGTFVEA